MIVIKCKHKFGNIRCHFCGESPTRVECETVTIYNPDTFAPEKVPGRRYFYCINGHKFSGK